jgi:Domain of unknown function (DUF6306)
MNKTDSMTLLDFYNMLLEAERAGVTVLGELVRQVDEERLTAALKKFLRDEGANCRVLINLIHDFGETPSDKTGAFVDKVRALETLDEKIQLLIRGQAWVARKIQEFHGLVPAGSPYLFLEAIKMQHDENVDTLTKYFEARKE